VADVKRAGRIGGDEFHAGRATLAAIMAAIAVALHQRPLDFGVEGRGGEEEIDEARAGHVHLADHRRGG
jgi:hypothetical protein